MEIFEFCQVLRVILDFYCKKIYLAIHWNLDFLFEGYTMKTFSVVAVFSLFSSLYSCNLEIGEFLLKQQKYDQASEIFDFIITSTDLTKDSLEDHNIYRKALIYKMLLSLKIQDYQSAQEYQDILFSLPYLCKIDTSKKVTWGNTIFICKDCGLCYQTHPGICENCGGSSFIVSDWSEIE